MNTNTAEAAECATDVCLGQARQSCLCEAQSECLLSKRLELDHTKAHQTFAAYSSTIKKYLVCKYLSKPSVAPDCMSLADVKENVFMLLHSSS